MPNQRIVSGIRAAIEKMIPDFERATGHKVKATFGSGGGTKQQVVRGEVFDVPIVQPPLSDVIASGHVVASSEREAGSGVSTVGANANVTETEPLPALLPLGPVRSKPFSVGKPSRRPRVRSGRRSTTGTRSCTGSWPG